MQLQFGVDVRRPDGGKLGELRRAVFDPGTQQITAIVVLHNRLDGREIKVPIGVVGSADDESASLDVSEEQFDQFEDFATTRNVAPPPDAAEVTSDLIDDPVDVPDEPPIGAATGVESIAFIPIVEEVIHVPTGDQVLDSSTTVWATDAELGHLIQLRLADETNRVESLIVEHGFFFHRRTEVAFDLVENVLSETIVLSVPASELPADDYE